ncbi:hypothetical protein NECID01_1642 [Nematocida sp. AWRm77]|nr:hypothetical protein NECID01_1642 [Nematocida sp. AWRm77]
MEESAVTNILKREVANKEAVELKEGKVSLNGKLYSKEINTTYVSKRNIPYTLGSIVLLYSMKEEDYGDYLKQCKKNSVDPVSYIDRERILADLQIPSVDESLKINLPSRLGSLTGESVMNRYYAQKKNLSGVWYIVVPKTKSAGVDTVRSVLLSHPDTKETENGCIVHKHCKYKLVDEPVSAEDLGRIAAVFIDGSSWQFKIWPKEISSMLRTMPVFYLFQENFRSVLPDLFESVIVLKISEDTQNTSACAATTFWAVVGCLGPDMS